MMSRASHPPSGVQSALISALRGVSPPESFSADEIQACLRFYECGGYLHHEWNKRGSPGLPDAWAEAARRAHRKTQIDGLTALAEFREVGGLLRDEGVPFILLKGAAYLVDLYPDPGARALTDVDLLVRPEDAGRAARGLAARGFAGSVGRHYPEDMRFEMVAPGAAPCGFEIHWSLGLPGRMTIDQDAIWRESRPVLLEGVPCLALRPAESLLFHVGHQADHYFGPTLKWALDLREMLRRWEIEPARLAEQSRAWGVRTALYLALLHLEKLFPGEAGTLLDRTSPGPSRLRLLGPFLSPEPARLLRVDGQAPASALLRPLLFDRATDAAMVAARVAARSPLRLWRRLAGAPRRPWEAPRQAGERLHRSD